MATRTDNKQGALVQLLPLHFTRVSASLFGLDEPRWPDLWRDSGFMALSACPVFRRASRH